jgi:hypothetical protein
MQEECLPGRGLPARFPPEIVRHENAGLARVILPTESGALQANRVDLA